MTNQSKTSRNSWPGYKWLLSLLVSGEPWQLLIWSSTKSSSSHFKRKLCCVWASARLRSPYLPVPMETQRCSKLCRVSSPPPPVVSGPHHQGRAGAVPLLRQVPGRSASRSAAAQAAVRPRPVQRSHLDTHPCQGAFTSSPPQSEELSGV